MNPAQPTPFVGEVDDDLDYGGDGVAELQTRLAPLRAEKGVARLRFGSGTRYVLLRHGRGRGVQGRDALLEVRGVPADVVPVPGPQHHRLRRPRTHGEAGIGVAGLPPDRHPHYVQPVIRPTAEELATELAPLGEADLMATFAKKYPMRITCRLLGIPRDDEEKMASWATAMLHGAIAPDAARATIGKFTAYVGPLVDERRAHPCDDLLSALVTEEVDGQRLGDDEVLGFLRLLFPAGVDTTWQGTGNLLYAVLAHPELHQRLLDSEEERTWAVEEMLRWEPPVSGDMRLTLQDVVVSGVEIPAGQEVRLAIAVANRDPDVFGNPDRFDLDRRPTEHITFGLGRHFCLGAFLTRVELRVALDVLLHRLPGLRLLDEPRVVGMDIRGPKVLRVGWDVH